MDNKKTGIQYLNDFFMRTNTKTKIIEILNNADNTGIAI
jgi:hypothetical protein